MRTELHGFTSRSSTMVDITVHASPHRRGRVALQGVPHTAVFLSRPRDNCGLSLKDVPERFVKHVMELDTFKGRVKNEKRNNSTLPKAVAICRKQPRRGGGR